MDFLGPGIYVAAHGAVEYVVYLLFRLGLA